MSSADGVLVVRRLNYAAWYGRPIEVITKKRAEASSGACIRLMKIDIFPERYFG